MPSLSLIAFDFPSPLLIKGNIELKETQVLLSFQWDKDLIKKGVFNKERKVGLWNETCFEAFFLKDNGHYDEWNFSLDGAWNAYHFTSYRQKAAPWEKESVTPPRIALKERELLVTLEKFSFIAFQLSAIIKINGKKTYYALSHPTGTPDFHNGDYFKLID